MVKITFIGAAGRVNTTAVANFTRFEESKGLDMALYDIDQPGMLETIEIVKKGMNLTGNKFSLFPEKTMEDALNGADIILFCAKAKPTKHPPFNLSDDLGNVELMQEIIKIAEKTAINNYRVINFANPTDKLAIMVKTLNPEINITALCTGPEEFKRTIMMYYKIPLEEEHRVDIDWVGCNHYGLIPGLRIDGKDIIEDLKESYDFDWRNFKGLRYGDGYDLATNLSLLHATGILTAPLGHVEKWHNGVPKAVGGGRYRPTKNILLMMSTSDEDDATDELYWELMDSWGTRQVAMATLGILGRSNKEFFMQAPNNGYLEKYNDNIFIETPGTFKNGEFKRKQFEISDYVQNIIGNEALRRYMMSKSIAEQDYAALIRAMMLHGSSVPIPVARKIIGEKWGLEENLEDLYVIPDKDQYKKFPI
ncbi:MAG: hypothetical protein GF364_12930 [Candidatus Lokiarchaeota archaeon]|nr:hypothetical protein [Candidatus Lokiarchaeota archaeon]